MREMKKAFTLIELLVVVAIIALLISILLPSLAKARAQARLVLCSTHLREYVNASCYYLEDYDDTFLPHKQIGGALENERCSWFNLLDKYTGSGQITEAVWDDDKQGYAESQHQLAICPDLEMDDEWEFNNSGIGYGYNAFWLGLADWQGVTPSCKVFPNAVSVRWMKASMVKTGSECIMYSDSAGMLGGGDYEDMYSSTLFYPFIATTREGVYTRHMVKKGDVDEYRYEKNPMHGPGQTEYPMGVAPVAFVDGHAEKMMSSNVNRIIDARRYWDPFQNIGGLMASDEEEVKPRPIQTR